MRQNDNKGKAIDNAEDTKKCRLPIKVGGTQSDNIMKNKL